MAAAAERFARLSTPTKLLLILTAALLPIGLGLGWMAASSIREANQALRAQTQDDSATAVRSIESLIARNALALRITANGVLAHGTGQACARARRSLTIAPGVAHDLTIQDSDGELVCSTEGSSPPARQPLIAPGDIRVRVGDVTNSMIVSVGVNGGMATATIPQQEVRTVALAQRNRIVSLIIRDGEHELAIINPDEAAGQNLTRGISEWPLANGQLIARIGVPLSSITTFERLVILLPVLMWFIAALMTWLMVTRLLIQPLRRLQRAVAEYEPGDPALELPSRLGPATEIQGLRDAFARAVTRVQESERDMSAALEGQRRLVHEVHHRVKNNLQVIASLLNIHGRTAETPTARAAYGAIGRRVGALAIVHRHHYAEMEESRGISLRPLLAELAAELRAGAPDSARGLMIDLEVEPLNTTQDVAVSTAFLVTEVVEFAMLHRPDVAVEISVERTSELTGRLTLASPVLNPDQDGDKEKVQFERIIAGLAKQLRSTLDRRLGRYSVDLPAFPPR
ncbi:MAG TPA: sensor histidine kinase [Sphingomicrobium sp.]|nr:sensor histidine kinase [Sphingomicrobium sp.]